MLDIIAILIMLASFILMVRQHLYFRVQKRKVQKYPYFKLRDQIISAIIDSKDYNKYESIYELVNITVTRLKLFKFSFYSIALDEYLKTILHRAVLNNFEVTEETFKTYDSNSILPEAKALGQLLINSARQNSWLLWLATTKIGFNIFVTSKLIKHIIQLFRDKLKVDKIGSQYDVAQKYSYLNHQLAEVRI